MASLRRSTRRQDENVNEGTARSTRSRGALPAKSDENAPNTRRALGDIENILRDRKAPPQTSDSPRKPFSDRNAPVQLQGTSSKKAVEKQSRVQTRDSSRPKTAGKDSRTRQDDGTTRSQRAGSSRRAPEPSRTNRQGKTQATEKSSHVQVPSSADDVASSPANSLSALIEAAAKHDEQAPLSHEELSRLSPNLDSDDLEYFDVDTIPQTRPLTITATTKEARRGQGPSSKDEGSDGSATASHGSSDKENVPPPAARRAAATGNRQSARTRAGVLRDVEDQQPTHSTPISQKRKALRDHHDDDHVQSAGPYLDDLFAADSDRSSQVPSLGVARRAEPMTASAKQLQDYQERGVSKVIEWKAAGHHEGERRAGGNVDSDDISNADSWPDDSRDDGFNVHAKHRSDGGGDNDDDDMFGFLSAAPHIRDRSTQVVAESLSFDDDRSQVRSAHGGSDVYVDLPTDPFNTSDDRRLAEQAFAHMSSPLPRHEDSSSTAPLDEVVTLGKHELRAAPHEDADADADAEAEDEIEAKQKYDEADLPGLRVARSRTKRKSTATTPAAVAATPDDEHSALSSPSPATRKRSERAAKARKATSGIPLKRNEKKEQEMLAKLEAQDTSSPAHSSPPSTPRASRTSKKAAASPAAKKLRMDDILTLLPPRKRQAAATKTPASVNKRKGSSATTRTSKAAKASQKAAATPKAKATKGKGQGSDRKRRGSTPEESIVVDDDSDEAPQSRAVKKNTKATSTSKSKTAKKRKKRVVSDDEDENEDEDQDNWRHNVGSSPIHSDDSERTKRLKEFRAADDYNMEVELVI